MTEEFGVFDVGTARSALDATRKVHSKATGSKQLPQAPLAHSVPRRFGKTKGTELIPYPDHGNCVPFVFTDRTYDADEAGTKEVEETDWDYALLGSSTDDEFIVEGTLCWVDFDGLHYWLTPICTTCEGSGIKWDTIELLSVTDGEAAQLQQAALSLAKRIGLDVSGVNERVWPNGANRFGGMIGVVTEENAAAILTKWNSGGTDLTTPPYLYFHGAPGMRVTLAALEPLEEALCEVEGTEEPEPCGRYLVAFTDVRRRLQERTFAVVSDPVLVDWATAVEACFPSDVEHIVSQSIDASRLVPEIDDPRVLEMTCGEFLEAAAWSVGGQWRLRTSGDLELQGPGDADDTEAENREGTGFDLTIMEGAFDQEPIRGVRKVELAVRESLGAVPWPRGDASFTATASPVVKDGRLWNPQSTALWERAPINSSQENATELQTLADALLADMQAWTGTYHRVVLEGFAHWVPSARDRVVRWIDRGECRTIVEGLSPEHAPKLLPHRSAVWPREASIAHAITDTSVTQGSTVVATLVATAGRPSRKVIALYPSFPAGLTIPAGTNVWLSYDRSGGQWVLPAYTY